MTMTPENFCYWLQGYFEISGGKALTKEQATIIIDHLKLVFEKKTPVKGPLSPSPWSPSQVFNGQNFNNNWNDYPIAPDCAITKIPVSC